MARSFVSLEEDHPTKPQTHNYKVEVSTKHVRKRQLIFTGAIMLAIVNAMIATRFSGSRSYNSNITTPLLGKDLENFAVSWRKQANSDKQGVARVLAVIGTRPELIKMAPVVTSLKAMNESFETVVCSTGQHRELLLQTLSGYNDLIHVDVDLNLMRPDQSLSRFVANALQDLDMLLRLVQPDLVLVQGDTSSAMAAALAAFYRKIPVGHIEAGLRTNVRYSPFPEEANRKIISTLATYHFAATTRAQKNLHKENIEENVYLTGNTVIDAVQAAATLEPSSRLLQMFSKLQSDELVIIATVHRRENIGEGLQHICDAFEQVLQEEQHLHIFFSLHPNPSIRSIVLERLGKLPRLHLIEPLSYIDMAHMIKRSNLIVTDSGGIQEESLAFNKAVVVLRNNTEREELIEAGLGRLVGTQTELIVNTIKNELRNPNQRDKTTANPYGDGSASYQIVKVLQTEAEHLISNRN